MDVRQVYKTKERSQNDAFTNIVENSDVSGITCMVRGKRASMQNVVGARGQNQFDVNITSLTSINKMFVSPRSVVKSPHASPATHNSYLLANEMRCRYEDLSVNASNVGVMSSSVMQPPMPSRHGNFP